MSIVIQFVPFTSSIEPSFWQILTQLKIDLLKLNDNPIPIRGWYERGRWIRDSNSKLDETINFGSEFRIDAKSISSIDPYHPPEITSQTPGRVSVNGILKNFNTIEEFKSCDKQSLFNSFADQLWKSKVSSENLFSETPEFLAITFSDLKKYKYYYWFGFPVFIAKPSWNLVNNSNNIAISQDQQWPTLSQNDSLELSKLIYSIHSDQNSEHCWIVKRNQDQFWSISSIDNWITFFDNVPEESRYLIFIDPAVNPQAFGWPLRNILAHLQSRYEAEARNFSVIGFRDPIAEGNEELLAKTVKSVVVRIELPEQTVVEGRPAAVGWEKNSTGKLAPRVADLAPMMDPKRLAEQAVDLNLKLMRWRILPELNLEKISSTRCLLLGAGTLGCYVARTLVAWGVRKITFVDSAKVSFSNPVRQPLFEFNDCLDGGQPKAACAAKALRRIYPGLEAEGLELSIPMPGHPIPSNLIVQTVAQVTQLEKLFDDHDVIYMLMDSRESRWLPTLLGASKRKLIINAALGFDSYLVMRHGARSNEPDKLIEEAEPPSSKLPQIRQLGCYFCNDVVAPSDSLTDRTLDQMCTVTRPGLAPIASATAVEMMASVLQHPQGIEVLAEVIDKSSTKNGLAAEDRDAKIQESVLGLVPHQIRGFLSKFESLKLVGPAYDKCTACSETVIKEYQNSSFDQMLLRAFNEPKYLENLTGLSQLYQDSHDVNLESLEWDDNDDEGDDQ